MKGLVLIALATLACGEPTRFVPAAWSPDNSQVLVVIDAQQGPESVRAFAPGEPMLLEVGDNRPKRLLVYAYEPPATPEIDPVRCGVVLDDSNPLVLRLEGAYQTAPADLGSSDELAFERVTPGSSELPKVGYLNCISDRVNCDTLLFETINAPEPDWDAGRIAVVSDDVIFVATGSDDDDMGNSTSRLFRFDRTLGTGPDAFRRLVAPTSTTSHITGVGYDGAEVLALTEDAQLFHYDPASGDLLGHEQLAPGLNQLVAKAGVRIYFGKGGLSAVGAAITPITGVEVHDVAIEDAARVLAVGEQGLQIWDGQVWRAPFGAAPGEPFEQAHVAVDESAMVAVTQRGGIYERLGADEGWSMLEPLPGERLAFTSVAVLPEERYLLGGKAGLLNLRNKAGLCPMSPYANNVRYMVPTESRRHVWMGSSNFAGVVGDYAPLVRISIP